MYPSGHVFSECDSYEHGVDFPQGDVYRRLFRDDGTMIGYGHSKDGRLVDAFTIDPDSHTLRVRDGRGSLRQPTFDAAAYQDIWFYEGQPLVERTIVGGAFVTTVLHDNVEPGHAALLTVRKDASECLLQDGDEWLKSSDGQVARHALYGADQPSSKPTDEQRVEVVEQYRAARGKFMSRFARRAQSAGFSLKEMELEQLVVGAGQ